MKMYISVRIPMAPYYTSLLTMNKIKSSKNRDPKV
jgi:hypothetical protein